MLSVVPPLHILRQARSKGIRRSLALGADILGQQVRRRVRRDGDRQYVFVSHPIDNSGAPLVLLQIVTEYLEQYGPRRVRLITPSWTQGVAPLIDALPIAVEKGALMGPRLSGLQLALNRDDFVLLNTCTVHQGYVDYVLASLESGTLAHAHWFIHEDVDQLLAWSPRLLEPRRAARIRRLVDDRALAIMVPSEGARRRYVEALGTDGVRVVLSRVVVPQRYTGPRADDTFHRLDFLLSGPPFEGRKGHAIALDAFRAFMSTSYRADPTRYRDFTLHLVGIGESDELSRWIRRTGTAILGERLHVYPPLLRDDALDITAACNAVICCSLGETFGLAVAEAMLMRHVVLRNNSGGVDEQLRDGENGYFIGDNDPARFAAVIEKVLNRETTSDADLHRMGEISHSMIAPYATTRYRTQIESLSAPQLATRRRTPRVM